MTKTDITIEQALTVIERVAGELGLSLNIQGKGFYQIRSPGTGHKMYVQRSARLNRIDTSLDLPSDLVDSAGRPVRVDLKSHNGSIKCHVAPSLENLERVMRLLNDESSGIHVQNRPRPFAATPVHKPKPAVQPMPELALEPLPQEGSLDERLQALKARARLARVNRLLENDKTGRMTRAEAEAVEDGRISLSDLEHRPDAAERDLEEARQSGVEVEL